MIVGFADKATEDVYNGIDSRDARAIPKALWRLVVRKLDMLDAANDPRDLRAPPGNRLEKLKGDLDGFWSIRVNVQYRVVFAFSNGSASAVRVVDYH